MRIWADCIPCILKMALDVGRLSIKDEAGLKAFIAEVLTMPPLRGEEWSITSPEVVYGIWEKLVRITQDPDPLREVKAEQNRKALELYEKAREHIRMSGDPFLTALKLAVAGNAMDTMVGVGRDGSPGGLDTESLAITREGAEQLRKKFAEAENIAYLVDNCGEVVFDRLFLELLQEVRKRNVTVVVRHLPVLNDVTIPEALTVGLDEVAPVVDNGIPVPYPGTRLNLVSREIRDLLLNVELIISKGVGNLDSLTEEPELKGKTAFLFHGKCHPCCSPRGVSLGTLIVDHY